MNVRRLCSDTAIWLSYKLKAVSEIVHDLPVALLKVDDLIDMTNRYYERKTCVASWSGTAQAGLYDFEKEFLRRYDFKGQEKVLVIGVGGGREVFALAATGFQVVAIDVSKGMIENAKRISKQGSGDITYLVKSCYELDMEPASFDFVFFSGGSYGLIPSARKRVQVLGDIRRVLKEEGRLLLSFMLCHTRMSARHPRFFKLIAALTGGNRELQRGDYIVGGGEFHHEFMKENEILEETSAAGFVVDVINILNASGYKFAYLQKKEDCRLKIGAMLSPQ